MACLIGIQLEGERQPHSNDADCTLGSWPLVFFVAGIILYIHLLSFEIQLVFLNRMNALKWQGFFFSILFTYLSPDFKTDLTP